MMEPQVSFVLITRNRMEPLKRCLLSLLRQQGVAAEIVVVDNASDDGTGAMLAEEFPDVHVIRSDTNLGVGGGRNLGIEKARTELCILLDDDAELVEADAAHYCMQQFDANETFVAINFRVICAKNGEVVKKLVPRRDRRIFDEDTEGAMFYGTGFAIRRKAFLDAGGFWPRLGLYFGEDTELCYRLLDAGWRIMHTAKVTVLHHQSMLERPTSRRLYHGTRNTPWMALRHLPWFSVVSLTVLSWGYFFLQSLATLHFGAFCRGVADSICGWPAVYRERKVISAEALATLKRCSGVYFY